MVLRLISFARHVSTIIIIRRAGGETPKDQGITGASHLLVSATAHGARVGDRKRIAHVGADGIRGDIGILRGRREVLALVVIVRTAHLRDRWRERRAHVLLLLLLLLERIQRPHAGEGEGSAAARRAVAVLFTNLLLVVGRRVAVLRTGKRRRGIGGRAGIPSGLSRLASRLLVLLLLLLLLLLMLRVRHGRRRGRRAVEMGGEVRAVAVTMRHDGSQWGTRVEGVNCRYVEEMVGG